MERDQTKGLHSTELLDPGQFTEEREEGLPLARPSSQSDLLPEEKTVQRSNVQMFLEGTSSSLMLMREVKI